MIDWAKLKRKQKKKNELRDLEFTMENLRMENIIKSENFRLVGEKQASKILGISYTKLKYLRQQGKIGFVRVGRSVKYKLSQLESFIERGIVEADSVANNFREVRLS
jgi:excisionase family DNA binding protein